MPRKRGGGKWGGARPGSGPKPNGRALSAYRVLLTPQQVAALREWGGGDLSSGVRWLVDAAAPLVGEAVVTLKKTDEK